MSKQVAVWLDHKEAHVTHVHPERLESETVVAPSHIHHKHPKGASEAKSHPNDAKRYFHEVAKSLEGAEKILITGPSTAKLDFLRYLREHDQKLEKLIVGIETVDHPTAGEGAAYARKYFAVPSHPT